MSITLICIIDEGKQLSLHNNHIQLPITVCYSGGISAAELGTLTETQIDTIEANHISYIPTSTFTVSSFLWAMIDNIHDLLPRILDRERFY